MASTADIRNGLCIRYKEGIYQVVDFQHVKPGKGPAFVRTKLKNVETGKVLDNTFASGHKIDPVRVETREYQYLYAEDDGYHFMNMENYEQIFLQSSMIEKKDFLREEMICQIMFDADEEAPLVVEIPDFIEAEITYTEPGVKGDTATNTLKPATIDTGAEIRVPLFINTGEKIKVDTRDGTYAARL